MTWRFRQSGRTFFLVTITIVAIILHGSLYPYSLRMPPGGGSPVAALIGSWAEPPRSFGDFAANILLYIPFGLFTSLALGPRARVWLITLAGLLLCTTIEICQFYDQGRVANASDLYLNTFGTWAGAMVGRALGSRPRKDLSADRLNLVPGMLLAAFLGWRLYPYVPIIDLHKYWNSLKPVLLHPNFNALTTLRYFALWLTISYVFANVTSWRMPRLTVLLFTGAVFTAKVLIVNQSISLSEVVAAAFAISVWLLALRRTRRAALAVACVVCAAVAIERLEPLDFLANHRAFGWLPFSGFLHGSLAINVQSFLEKAFLYGAAIWTLNMVGTHVWAATGGVAILLLATSFAEIYLPGRSGEITDAIMVLLMGAIIAALKSSQRDGEPTISEVAVQNRPPA